MAAYLQMGHDSENLVGVPGLEGFAGLVLSPVNRSEGELSRHIPTFRKKGNFDIVFDPQLYCPKSERGELANHSYFPQDLDTADISSSKWWQDLIKKLVAEATSLKVDAVCSPVILPSKYTQDYYATSVELFSSLAETLGNDGIRPVHCLRFVERFG